jgi:hypothetical protein
MLKRIDEILSNGTGICPLRAIRYGQGQNPECQFPENVLDKGDFIYYSKIGYFNIKLKL